MSIFNNNSAPKLILRALITSIILLNLQPISKAQTDDEVNAIIKGLAPIQNQQKSSGSPIVIEKKTIVIEGRPIYIYPRRNIEREIYFDFNSDEIKPRAARQLESLGRALESEQLRYSRYLIAGHTDAVGSDQYNIDLSKRRAQSVYQFLIVNFAIDPDRLITTGFGFRRLKDKNNPTAAINRRTEIILIADE